MDGNYLKLLNDYKLTTHKIVDNRVDSTVIITKPMCHQREKGNVLGLWQKVGISEMRQIIYL